MRTIDTAAFLDTVCRLLADGAKTVPVPVTGTSMCPFLHPGDTAYLDLPEGELKKGDVILFRRPTGEYILHRIVQVGEDGVLILLGDSQLVKERVEPAWVRARMVKARRSGRLIGPEDGLWRRFQRDWVWLIPVRRQIFWMRNVLRRRK